MSEESKRVFQMDFLHKCWNTPSPSVSCGNQEKCAGLPLSNTCHKSLSTDPVTREICHSKSTKSLFFFSLFSLYKPLIAVTKIDCIIYSGFLLLPISRMSSTNFQVSGSHHIQVYLCEFLISLNFKCASLLFWT